MHDPMVVAFDIRRPWPSLRSEKVKEGQPRWEVTIYRKHGKSHDGWNPRRWWRPGSWSPFVTVFGRRWYFPSMVTIWHVEPGGHDSGEICKHWVGGKHRNRWRWHVWHWQVQVIPIQRVRHYFDRCEGCKQRMRRSTRIGTGWDSKGVMHDWCYSLRHVRGQLDDFQKYVRGDADQTQRWRVEYWLQNHPIIPDSLEGMK